MDREKLYQPFVVAENIRRLYKIKIATGKCMTKLINEAVELYWRERQWEESKA